jgi:hypothetical protein
MYVQKYVFVLGMNPGMFRFANAYVCMHMYAYVYVSVCKCIRMYAYVCIRICFGLQMHT